MPPLPGVLALLSPPSQSAASKSFNPVVSSTTSVARTASSYLAEFSVARADLAANRMNVDHKFNSTSNALSMTSSSPSNSAVSAMSLKNSAAPCSSTTNDRLESSDSNNHLRDNSNSSGKLTDAALVSNDSKMNASSNGNTDNSSSSSSTNSSNSKDNDNSKSNLDTSSNHADDSCDSKDNENALVESSSSTTANSSTENESDLSSTSMFGRPRKILLKNINAHITCSLCKGYLIDATTIVECLHSFCHSCIMNYLRKDQYCPRCEMMINTTKHNNIKLDTTLQAIVYKLVPGLYEKELLRKRAFYSTRPEEAKLATPEQRGEDTEHLIFGPTDNMSLSLEYADVDGLPEDDTLRKPKYLQCPANFTVAHLKKFVFGKFGIDQYRFAIEMMYKVKTIVLADHYKMMDVAYIYTWKRDAPMKFFFRVKESDNPPRRRIPRPMPKSIENSIKETTAAVAEVKDEEPSLQPEIKVEVKEEEVVSEAEPAIATHEAEGAIQPSENNFMVVVPLEVPAKTSKSIENIEVKRETDPIPSNTDSKNSSPSNHTACKDRSDKSPSENRTEKLKITLVNRGKNTSKDDETPKSKSNSKNKQSKHASPETDDRKVENIKLKFDLSKQGSVTIINMSSPESAKKEVVKPIKPEKEWKIKVKKDKEKETNSSNGKSKSSPHEKTVPPITIELDKPKSASSTDSEEKDEDIKKSEFLNSIDLTPIKSISSPEKNDKQKTAVFKVPASVPPTPSFSIKKPLMPPPPPPAALKLSAASKRKSKEPIKAVSKKPRLDLPIAKTPIHPQIKVRSNLLDPKTSPGISFKLAPFPIGAGAEVTKSTNSSSSTSSVAANPMKDLEKSRKTEDKILMPAPPPLKMLDVFKRNGMKSAKGSSKTKQQSAKSTKSLTSEGFLRPIVTTSMAQNSKVPIVSNVMGNRTPIARRYPLILPKSPRNNPFANISGDGGFLQNNATEIKPIQNGDSKEIKVYGPPATSVAVSAPKAVLSVVTTASSSPLPPTNQRPMPKTSASSNYLNYALFNSSKSKMSEVPLGCRTPIYTPSSPSYSPNSPQYMPNYNIPMHPTYKYTKTQSSATNYLQNILDSNKQLSNLFPGPPVKKSSEAQSSSTKYEPTEKQSKPSKSNAGKISPEPTEKQTPVQSLLNSCNINIPSSLSITIRNEEDDAESRQAANLKHSNPVNNYIEILKLPDVPLPATNEGLKGGNSTESKPPMASKSPANLKLPGITINPRISPPGINTSPQLKQDVSPNAGPKPSTPTLEKKSPPSAPHKTGKKTPSPDKKHNDKPNKRAEKRPASDLAKSPKDKIDISPAALKKFRPILPRSKTPPANPSNMLASISPLPANISKLATSNAKQSPPKSKKTAAGKSSGGKKSSPQQNITNTSSCKKSEPFVDLTTTRKSITPPASTVSFMPSPPGGQPTGLSPELSAFLLQQQRQLQQQQQQQQQQHPQGPLTPSFLPHLATFHPAANLNIQRAYVMEQLARMQKAGQEALERVMQQLKNNNTNCVKSPSGSPGSNSGSNVATSVANTST